LAAADGLAGGPARRELGDRCRLRALVLSYCSYRHRARIRHLVRSAAAAWNGRGSRFPVVFEDYRPAFSRGASWPRQLGDYRRTGTWSRIRHAVGRHADGAFRLAAIFHRAGTGEPALAGALDQVDADGARGSGENHQRTWPP